jgi:CHAD domain-containing protein
VSTREREVKLAASAEFQLPLLTDEDGGVFAGIPDTVVLDATYFDTDDLRLARAGATLRHRSDEGWLVKLPAPGGGNGLLSRDEHRIPGAPFAPPAAALDLVRALSRRQELSPVARLRTTRRRVQLHDADGTPVAEVVDDSVEVLEGNAEVPQFRELEIELTDEATDAQLAAVLARLRTAGAGAPDPTPKLVHALGPRADAPPDVVVPDAGRADHPSIADVVRYAVASSVKKLIAHDPGVRLGVDAEDVHQARVATRRLRSHLGTFRSLVDEQWATSLRDELRWLGEVLGGVRDSDVLLERLEAKLDRLPEPDRAPAGRLLDILRADADGRRTLLIEAFDGTRYLELLDRLVDAARRPRLLLRVDDDDEQHVLRDLVGNPWRKLADEVDALDDEPPDSDLHKIRIRAKRARYAAEAVEPAFGKSARAFARAMTDVQDVLGEHQDAVVAAEWLRRAAARTDDEAVGFAAGQLAALEHLDALAARAAWPKVWKRASRKRVRSWL